MIYLSRQISATLDHIILLLIRFFKASDRGLLEFALARAKKVRMGEWEQRVPYYLRVTTSSVDYGLLEGHNMRDLLRLLIPNCKIHHQLATPL
jgi:hypothetical protein